MDLRRGGNVHAFHFFTQGGRFLFIGLLTLAFVFFLSRFQLATYFPIKNVHVYGVSRSDPQEIKAIVLPHLDRGFFAAKVDVIRDKLKPLPWIGELSVRRRWPDKIEINIIEKDPVASWNNQTLITGSGELFAPHATFAEVLPVLAGPDGQHMLMLNYFYKINRLLQPLHAKISYLELTSYLTWKLKLNNGITLQIGHKDILTRLDHFVKVYPKIVGNRSADVEYIDLRYPNGMAVRWKANIKN